MSSTMGQYHFERVGRLQQPTRQRVAQDIGALQPGGSLSRITEVVTRIAGQLPSEG